MLRVLLFLIASFVCYGANNCTQSLITDIATSGTTALTVPGAGNRLFICALYVDTQVSSGNPVVSLQSGNSTGCGPDATALFAIPLSAEASTIARESQTYLTANQGLCVKVEGSGLTAGRLQLFYGTNSGSTVTVTGTFQLPTAVPFTGRLEVSLTRATVTNSCTSSSVQRIIRPVSVAIANGVMGALTLPPSGCLTPKQLYHIRMFDSRNVQIYRRDWDVPNTGSGTIDVTQIQ